MWRLIQLLNCTIYIWFDSQLYTTYSCNTTTRLLHLLWRWITMHWSELQFVEMFSNRTSVNFNWMPLLPTESGCDGWIIDGRMDGAWHGLQIHDLAVNYFRWILNVTLTTRRAEMYWTWHTAIIIKCWKKRHQLWIVMNAYCTVINYILLEYHEK